VQDVTVQALANRPDIIRDDYMVLFSDFYNIISLISNYGNEFEIWKQMLAAEVACK
jgi:hypothetical protein